MKRFIVTAVDYGDSCDGKARVLKVCKELHEAMAFVKNDIEVFVQDSDHDEGYHCDNVDYVKMSVSAEDGNNGCEWNIEEVEFD